MGLLKMCMRKNDEDSALQVALFLWQVHLSVLGLLCDLLALIARNFDTTHMDSASLTIVMAPTLVHQERVRRCEEDVEHLYPWNIQVFIQNADNVGALRPGICLEIVSSVEMDIDEKSWGMRGRGKRLKLLTKPALG